MSLHLSIYAPLQTMHLRSTGLMYIEQCDVLNVGFFHSIWMHDALLCTIWRTTMTTAKYILLLHKMDVFGVPIHTRTVHTVRRPQSKWRSLYKLPQSSQPPEFNQAKIIFLLALVTKCQSCPRQSFKIISNHDVKKKKIVNFQLVKTY